MPDTTATREPLVTTASLVALVTGLFSLAAYLGLHIDPQLQDAALRAVPVVATLAPIAVALIARRHVTPLADPRGTDGTPLIPATRTKPPTEAAATPVSADPTPAQADPAP